MINCDKEKIHIDGDPAQVMSEFGTLSLKLRRTLYQLTNNDENFLLIREITNSLWEKEKKYFDEHGEWPTRIYDEEAN